jgi:hypothetical protein
MGKYMQGFIENISWGHTSTADDAKKQLFVYEHDAGRFELLVWILYWILIGIVLWIYGMVAFLRGAIQWIHILILAQRHEGLSNFIKGYMEYYVHVMNYMYFMTDIRQNMMPVSVKIF